ncbi:MAG TPA: TetR family transcriptional regulator [Aeromicrobium sp.]|jgi:AcrR family transcriptional regulator|nr:TetR family transcriptional regulator [Aeromicrobium sp.]HKY58734.1 TetR family transcriptional regulator [Aeromicrobium sp.]
MDLALRDSKPGSIRERLLDAAKALIEKSGWASVTMGKLAAAVGVSRQTAHTELGTKHQLAESLVQRELFDFLAFVQARLAAETDLIAGIRSAAQGVLEQAEQNLLLRTVLGSIPHETDDELLKLLTIDSGFIVDTAVEVVRANVVDYYSPLPFSDAELEMAADAIVRLVLSHVVRPSKPPAEAAADIARIVELAVLGTQVQADIPVG